MAERVLNVLSQNVGYGIIRTDTEVTSRAFVIGMDMWGSTMFGDVEILGAAYLITYDSDGERNVLSNDLSKNILRIRMPLFTVSLLTRMGMWGEAMFGSEDLLGTGTVTTTES